MENEWKEFTLDNLPFDFFKEGEWKIQSRPRVGGDYCWCATANSATAFTRIADLLKEGNGVEIRARRNEGRKR